MVKRIIALDLDGVIANTPELIGEGIFNSGYLSLHYRYEPYIYNCPDVIGLVNEVVDDIFFNNMDKILPYVDISFMEELYNKYHIVVLTARRPVFYKNTRYWLNQHFPNTDIQLVHRRSGNKTAYLKENNIQLFVEDRLRTANESASYGIKTFLVNKQWNEGRHTHQNIQRIKNLPEILTFL